jgi:hypothetical protein
VKSRIELLWREGCPHCPPARRAVEKVARERGARLDEYSTDEPAGRAKANEYGIRAVPTVIVKGPRAQLLLDAANEATVNAALDKAEGVETEKKKTGFWTKILGG